MIKEMVYHPRRVQHHRATTLNLRGNMAIIDNGMVPVIHSLQ